MEFMRKLMFIGVVCCVFNVTARADMFDFGGYLEYHNEVDYYYFSLPTSSTSVEIWTDSYDNGAHFDPITALWDGPTGNLIEQNDDNPGIRPADQTIYDSGISLPSLTAGDYFLTITRYANFASGTNIADGFAYDGQTPVPLLNCYGCYHLNLSYIDAPAPGPVVPLPGAFLLGMLGLGTAGIKLRKYS